MQTFLFAFFVQKIKVSVELNQKNVRIQQMVVAQMRASRIEISQSAINQNVQVTMQTSHATYMFLAIKANGYGHGLIEMAQAAKKAGVYGLAVAVVDEALAIRQAKLDLPILILGYTEPQYAEFLAQYQIITTVPSAAWLRKAQNFLTGNRPLLVSLAVDTGMNRIGMRTTDEVLEAVQVMDEHDNLFNWHGIMTHFATSDTAETDYFKMQLNRWHNVIDALPSLPPMIHVANSGAAMYHADEVPTEYIRVGTVVYGWEPSGKELDPGTDLVPAMNIKSALSFVKKIPAGEGISYGHLYHTTGEEWIGTIPLGYGDGINRKMRGFKILVGNEWCEIVGQIAMDQMMVRLPHEMPVGTQVTLLGSNGQQTIDIWDVCQHCGNQPWEFTNQLTDRMPRYLVD